MLKTLLASLFLVVGIVGCSSKEATLSFIDHPSPGQTQVVFDPFHDPYAAGASTDRDLRTQALGLLYLELLRTTDRLPVPNDLLRDPSSGKNALPPPPDSAPKYLRHAVEAMNSLSGFSTAGRITIPLQGTVDLTTVTPVSLLLKADSDGSSASYAPTLDQGSRLILTPTVPLKPETDYLVVLTSAVRDLSGQPYLSGPLLSLTKLESSLVSPDGSSRVPGLSDERAQAMEEIRQRMQPVWSAAEEATGVGRDSIPLAFSFRTQALFSTLTFIRDQIHSETMSPTITESYTTPSEVDEYYRTQLNVFHDVMDSPNGPVSGPEGVVGRHEHVGAIYLGTIPAPWYITDDTEGPFEVNERGEPVVHEVRNLEFMAILPKGEGPFPVTIFQHGLTRTKADMADLANDACARGRAMIGVDLVLHGANARRGVPNGFDFYNQDYLAMMRDNVRQSVVNLFALNRMLSSNNTDLDGKPGADLVGGLTSYIGHSEGAFIGGTFTPLEKDNQAAVLAGGSAQLLIAIQSNERFREQFDHALQLFGGIETGSFAYREYYFIAQTLMDDADSFNYLAHALDGSLRNGALPGSTLLQDMFEAINLPPLVAVSESQSQARALGAPQVSPLQAWPGMQTAAAPHQGSGEYQFQGGGHNWILMPSEGPPDGETTASSREQAFHFITSAAQGSAEIIHVIQGTGPRP